MKRHTKEFLNNNVCAIHHHIQEEILKVKEMLLEEGHNQEARERLEEVMQLISLAITKTTKIEDRLKLYLFTIRSLGFKREKKNECLSFINGDQLVYNKEGRKK